MLSCVAKNSKSRLVRGLRLSIRLLAAELEALKPLDGFALIGNDLGLPDQGDGHEAQGNNTKDENEANVGLVSRKPESAAKPSHSKESPSTWVHRLAVVRENPRRQHRGE